MNVVATLTGYVDRPAEILNRKSRAVLAFTLLVHEEYVTENGHLEQGYMPYRCYFGVALVEMPELQEALQPGEKVTVHGLQSARLACTPISGEPTIEFIIDVKQIQFQRHAYQN